jgi:hypothetical protein
MDRKAWGGIAGLLLWSAAAGCGGLPKIGTGGSTCMVTTDCSGGKVCVAGTCNTPGAAGMGSPCSATRDCGGGLACDALTGRCAKGGTTEMGGACTGDSQCKPPLRCGLDGFYGTCVSGGTADVGSTCQSSTDCLSGLLCGPNGRCASPLTAYPPWEGARCADEGEYRAYFEVPRPGQPPKDFFRLPFPNDIRVNATGALDISDFPKPGPTPLGVDLVQLYVDSWTADFDGFGANGAITFRFSKNIDYATATGANVLLIDLTSGFGLSRSWATYNGRNKYVCAHTVTVHNVNDEPLDPKGKYAAIITTGLKSETGESPVVDPDLAALLGATRPGDEVLGVAWDKYAPLRDWLTKQGTMAPTVAAAAVFTVQDAPGHMARLAANLAAQPAPMLKQLTLCSAGATSPCADGTPDRACGTPDPTFDEIHGTFSVPIYQAGTAPYEKPADGGNIVEGAGGVPTVARTEDVCFALTVPKGAAPAGGWPLVVYHHGTGGSMRSFIGDGVAAKMSSGTGTAAVFGFDGVQHGARRGGSTKKPDDLVFNPLNPRAARDNFLQGAADILQALRVATVSLDATTSPTSTPIAFNPARVAYYGHSQGSTSGELAVAFSATTGAAVFSGAGAYLTRSLLDKTMPVNIGAGMAFLIGEPLDAEHPVLSLFQSYFERSDPLNYNPLIVRAPPLSIPPKHVYMSWGKNDTYTPEKTLEANARSLGVPPAAFTIPDYTEPIARPVSANFTAGGGAKRTAAVFQYTPPSGVDGHFVTSKVETAGADWSAFLTSYLTGGTPTIP